MAASDKQTKGTTMRNALRTIVLAAFLAGCGAPGTSLEATQTDLVKETYTVQAPDGHVEFTIPDFDPEGGIPLVQVYEIDGRKNKYMAMSSVPCIIDTEGNVRAVIDPERWAVIVVVR